ncbi:conserved Plasmodium protein, unknown function [Plasmodium ovale curtisi]|uniref:At4g15545-like C-terminal domain-containing protein n=1 Tax=Plasmodium ovale curtisi TaxID=864141 RepID=A0A1A8WGK2_PLAOA|nr:conserved Plasmodium protein, unknown function [Plasmodium ovale curtisi]
MSNAGTTDLSWLPSDADEQLALGFKIVTNAYKTRVTSQEAEIRSLKGQLTEKLEQLSSIQKKYSNLEVQLIESTQRGNQLADENKQLITTIKKLNRDIDRLENLKKAVLNSIQEEHEVEDAHKVMGVCDPKEVVEPFRRILYANGTHLYKWDDFHCFNEHIFGAAHEGLSFSWLFLCGSSELSIFALRLSLAGMHSHHTHSFPSQYYSADDMLQTTAPRTMLEINGNEDSCQTLINKIVNSDTHNIINGSFNSPYLGNASLGEKNTDGKAFFRNARSRLTYEQFNQFLSNIKKLNNHQQKREETLKKAQIIFGEANADLYEEFKVLISKHS